MDAAQCLATLKALAGAAAAGEVSDIVMDPAWRRDPESVRSCAAATTTNAFRDDAPRRAARARACQWLRAKVAPDLRKDWDAMIQLGQNDVVETPQRSEETAEDAAGDVLMQLVSTGSLVDGEMDQTLPERFGDVFSKGILSQGKQLARAPPVYVIEDFVTDKERQAMLQWASAASFAQSRIDGGVYADSARSQARTSTSCAVPRGTLPEFDALAERAASLIGGRANQVEPLQVVRYEGGQRFDNHHDAGTVRPSGAIQVVPPRRIATLLLFLTSIDEDDDDAEGVPNGATVFPSLGIAQRPKAGAALLWPNVGLDGRPDGRTIHRGNPVRGTVKYAVNVWICAEDVGDRGVASLDLEKLRVKYGIASAAPVPPAAVVPPAPPAPPAPAAPPASSSSSSSSSSSESDDDDATPPAVATDFEAPD